MADRREMHPADQQSRTLANHPTLKVLNEDVGASRLRSWWSSCYEGLGRILQLQLRERPGGSIRKAPPKRGRKLD